MNTFSKGGEDVGEVLRSILSKAFESILGSSGAMALRFHVERRLGRDMYDVFCEDRERFHLFYEKDEELAKELNVHRFEPKDAEATGRIIAQYASRLIEKTGSPIIGVMGVDRLVQLAGAEASRQLALAQDETRVYRGLMLWIVKPIMPWIVERLAPIADIHLKVMREYGCTLLYGVKPETPLYAVQLRPGKTPPIPDLVRIT
jgi:hypothetical protein